MDGPALALAYTLASSSTAAWTASIHCCQSGRLLSSSYCDGMRDDKISSHDRSSLMGSCGGEARARTRDGPGCDWSIAKEDGGWMRGAAAAIAVECKARSEVRGARSEER